MNSFYLVVASPEGNLLSKNATALFLRGTEGELAVMAGHTPFVTSVVECECKIILEDGTELLGDTKGGLLTVSDDKVTLLSGSFTFK